MVVWNDMLSINIEQIEKDWLLNVDLFKRYEHVKRFSGNEQLWALYVLV